MKKTLIALAALAATSAFAQSAVTMYGVVDMGYSALRATNGANTTHITGMQSIASGSRLGVKGEEDLGGGLKANFLMELAIATDEAAAISGTSSNRQSFVGLSGGFGSLTLGRQYNLIHNVQGAYDTNGNATAAGWLGSATSSVRASNAYTYTTPSFSGLTASVQHSSGEVVGDSAGSATSVGINYANGPLTAALAQETVVNGKLSITLPGATLGNSFARPATSTTDLSDIAADRVARSAGIGYDFGKAKVTYLYTNAEAGSAALNGSVRTNNLGVSVPLGKVTVNATLSNGTATKTGFENVDLSGYQLGAMYSLSKRTTAYAFIGQAKAKDSVAEGKDETTGVGLRHTF